MNNHEDEELSEQPRQIGCKSIACGGCFIIIVLIITLILLIIGKPRFFWEPAVQFLNNDIVLSTQTTPTLEEAKTFIESQITELGENTVRIPEEYISVLLPVVLINFNNPTAEVDEQGMHIYWKVDTTIPEKPLMGKISIRGDEKTGFYAYSIGFERFGIPEFFAKALMNAVQSALQLIDPKSSHKDLIQGLFGINGDFALKKIEYKQDELVLVIDVNVKLFE